MMTCRPFESLGTPVATSLSSLLVVIDVRAMSPVQSSPTTIRLPGTVGTRNDTATALPWLVSPALAWTNEISPGGPGVWISNTRSQPPRASSNANQRIPSSMSAIVGDAHARDQLAQLGVVHGCDLAHDLLARASRGRARGCACGQRTATWARHGCGLAAPAAGEAELDVVEQARVAEAVEQAGEQLRLEQIEL